MKINTIGIDLAKNAFQLHATDRRGKKIFNKKVSRKDLMKTIDKVDKEEVLICIEPHTFWEVPIHDIII